MEIQPPDPALLRYLEAIDEFEARISVTPERLHRFAEAALGDRPEVVAGEIAIEGVEDYLLFERLHETALSGLADTFELEDTDGSVSNEWIERKAFVLRRRERADG